MCLSEIVNILVIYCLRFHSSVLNSKVSISCSVEAYKHLWQKGIFFIVNKCDFLFTPGKIEPKRHKDKDIRMTNSWNKDITSFEIF